MSNNVEEKKLKVAIAVVGVADSGKTTTIDMARKKLKRLDHIFRENHKNKQDERSVEIIDGVRVAFCPPGDTVDAICKGFKIAKENSAEILVYSQHASVNIMETISNKQSEENSWLIFMSKTKIPQNEEARINEEDEKFSDELVARISYLVKNVKDLDVFPYSRK